MDSSESESLPEIQNLTINDENYDKPIGEPSPMHSTIISNNRDDESKKEIPPFEYVIENESKTLVIGNNNNNLKYDCI